MGFIYKITSLSNKMYVGQTKKKVPQKRWKEHCRPSSKRCVALKRAIDKYGAENMTFEVVEECSDAMLNDREQHWIRELGTLSPHGYNLTTGGDVCEFSEETKVKISTTRLQKSIDTRGYVGSINESGGYVNAIAPDGSYLGTYSTREEAQEALREYTRDPENFVPKLRKRKQGTGSVSPHTHSSGRVRWQAQVVQNKELKYLGLYDTKEEAENACARYLENPDGFVPPTENRKPGTGRVYKSKNGKRWNAVYKNKRVGTFDTEAQAETAILAHKEKIEGKKPLKE